MVLAVEDMRLRLLPETKTSMMLETKHHSNYCNVTNLNLKNNHVIVTTILDIQFLSIRFSVNSFSTWHLSSCTDEYAYTYDISTYPVQQ